MEKTSTRAWKDTQNWVIGYKFWPYIIGFIFVLVCAMLATLLTPINASRLINALCGLAGGIGALVIFVLVVYIVHLVITPNRQRNEARREFIRCNASYDKKIIGDITKQKYLAILDTLQALIKIENTIADNMFGSYRLTPSEFNTIQSKLRKEMKIPSHISRIYSPEEFTKLTCKIIEKSGLKIINDEKLTEKQIEFLIKSRAILDELGIGLQKGLKNCDEYTNLLKIYDEQTSGIDAGDLPYWILVCLAIPSGMNSAHLFWSYLSPYDKLHLKYLSVKMQSIPEFKLNRDSGIEEMIQIFKKEIDDSYSAVNFS